MFGFISRCGEHRISWFLFPCFSCNFDTILLFKKFSYSEFILCLCVNSHYPCMSVLKNISWPKNFAERENHLFASCIQTRSVTTWQTKTTEWHLAGDNVFTFMSLSSMLLLTTVLTHYLPPPLGTQLQLASTKQCAQTHEQPVFTSSPCHPISLPPTWQEDLIKYFHTFVS